MKLSCPGLFLALLAVAPHLGLVEPKHFLRSSTLHVAAPLLGQTSSASPKPKHFVLVHGPSHGAWAWFRLAALIKASGNNVTALDMSASGINPLQVGDLEDSISDYYYPLHKLMVSIPTNERVVLVGHSLGGTGVAQAMEMFPEKIALAVFIAGNMIGPNLSVSESYRQVKALEQTIPLLDSIEIHGNGPENHATALLMGPQHLAKHLYQLSPAEDLELALTLVRPFKLYTEEQLSKELVFSQERYGSVRRVYIVAEEDKNMGREFQEWVVEKNPPNEVVRIQGADHMVMSSKPVELLFALLDVADKYE